MALGCVVALLRMHHWPDRLIHSPGRPISSHSSFYLISFPIRPHFSIETDPKKTNKPVRSERNPQNCDQTSIISQTRSKTRDMWKEKAKAKIPFLQISKPQLFPMFSYTAIIFQYSFLPFAVSVYFLIWRGKEGTTWDLGVSLFFIFLSSSIKAVLDFSVNDDGLMWVDLNEPSFHFPPFHCRQ